MSDEIKNNIKQFSKFLSYVCDVEREKGTTIIHSLGNKSNSFLKFAERNASQVKMEKGGQASLCHQLNLRIR